MDAMDGQLVTIPNSPIQMNRIVVTPRGLYDTLENEIIPLYYHDRGPNRIPVNWIEYTKESIRTLLPQFSMQRMLKEYTHELYQPAMAELSYRKKK